jgi:hypothetical protein
MREIGSSSVSGSVPRSALSASSIGGIVQLAIFVALLLVEDASEPRAQPPSPPVEGGTSSTSRCRETQPQSDQGRPGSAHTNLEQTLPCGPLREPPPAEFYRNGGSLTDPGRE